MNAPWTDEDELRLAELVRTGMAWWEIGARLDRTGPACQQKASELNLGLKPYTGNRSVLWTAIVIICSDGRPRTVHDLVRLTGGSRPAIDAIMKKRRASGNAHVADWARSLKGPAKPLWLPEPGIDAPKLHTLTKAERQLARMHRIKREDPLGYKAILDRTVVRRRLKKGTVTQQHPLVQALFGMGARP
ncbi:hypothetical protein [Cupriavidus pampae]|uniref:Myb-like domain-containing protein n=1 Tax=Cupriavidus pampae TaxID=659251 RepID=A0ABM8XC99_9BURK|nr:hypothetical protein [Cupriavidus pampae]CAG9177704.1 hypothetical protein LMG32289_03879 [Cupriavidus pampae]